MNSNIHCIATKKNVKCSQFKCAYSNIIYINILGILRHIHYTRGSDTTPRTNFLIE